MTINLRQKILFLCQLFWALAIHSFTARPRKNNPICKVGLEIPQNCLASRDHHPPSVVQHLTKLAAVPPTSFGSLLQQTNADAFQEEAGTKKKSKSVQKWRCDVCACGFDKLKNYNEHLQGKKHKAVMAQADDTWREYKSSGPTFYDKMVAKEVVMTVWSLDAFMDGLQARSRSSFKRVLTFSNENKGQIDPNIRLEDLSPDKRAMLWRHLHTSNIATMISALPPKYVRVKEILESLEVFKNIQTLLRRSTAHGQKVKKVETIYDIGCGHGLVGMLCATAYPNITVQSIDIIPRESFQAQRSAFETSSGVPLDNLHFVAGDLTILEEKVRLQQHNNNTLLLCVHGCKSLTHESIELARSNHWAWLSLPCCLQAENHLDANMKVSDDMRFGLLCGAIAAKYEADTIASIDRRITGRGIVISASGK